MMNNTFQITHLLHGKTPNKNDLIAIYAFGVLGTVLLLVLYGQQFVWWQNLIFASLALDILGGVIANMTVSTKSWWQSQSQSIQILFLLAHGLQPMAFAYFLDGNAALLGSLYAAVLLVGLVLLNLPVVWNRAVALIAVIGLIVGFLYWNTQAVLSWFIVAYCLKLVAGFSWKLK